MYYNTSKKRKMINAQLECIHIYVDIQCCFILQITICDIVVFLLLPRVLKRHLIHVQSELGSIRMLILYMLYQYTVIYMLLLIYSALTCDVIHHNIVCYLRLRVKSLT